MVDFLFTNAFRYSNELFRWELLHVDRNRLPGTVVLIAPAFVESLRLLVHLSCSHSKDTCELYIVVDVTWKTCSSGWGWLKIAAGAKGTNSKTRLPSTALVDMAYGRVPKENIVSIQGSLESVVMYYQKHSIDLRKMQVNVHFDDSQAGRLTSRSLHWCFYRDIRHQIAAIRRHAGDPVS